MRNSRNDTSGDVRAYFERAAATFDRLYAEERQGPLMRRLNRRFRSDIARRFVMALQHAQAINADSVLDVGCGSGRYLCALAGIGVGRLVGIDVSEPMLELARAHLRETPASRVDLVHGEFMGWATEERFDLVVAMGFFDYQSDPAAALRRMRELSRHSIMASFPSVHWFRTPFRRFRYLWKRCPVHFYRRAQVAEFGRLIGATRTEIAEIPGGGMDYVTTFWFV
jgi:SAM-dependent methyltransferase